MLHSAHAYYKVKEFGLPDAVAKYMRSVQILFRQLVNGDNE